MAWAVCSKSDNDDNDDDDDGGLCEYVTKMHLCSGYNFVFFSTLSLCWEEVAGLTPTRWIMASTTLMMRDVNMDI